MQISDSKIERLIRAARMMAYPENMIGIRNESGVEKSTPAGTKSICHLEAFEKSSRFEIFVSKEEMIEIRSALDELNINQ